MTRTMVKRIQESKRATNIYLTSEVAEELGRRLARAAKKGRVIRLTVLNKESRPDIQVYVYSPR